MEKKEKNALATKIFAIGACVVAIGVIAALVAVLVSNANKKTVSYNATFVANTDPNKEGRIQGSESKTYNNITKIDAPYATDALVEYTFDYWCSDQELTKPVSFPVTLNKNETYYAHWSMRQPSSYRVTFNTDGGTTIGETSVAKGNSITRPDVSKSHCDLKAWHENNLEGKEVFKKIGDNEYETYTPTGNVVLFAEWVQTEFNVGLVTNGGSFSEQDAFKDVNIGGVTYLGYEYVKIVNSAPYPVKANSSFQGWFTSSEFSEESFVKFPLEVKSDMVLYAKWEDTKELPTLTIDANGGYLPRVYGETSDPQIRVNKTNFLPYSPTAYYLKTYKDQYNLVGWFFENGNQVSFPFNIESDTKIIAKWDRVRFDATVYGNEKEGTTTTRKLDSWENLARVRYADYPTPVEGDKDLSSYGEESSAKNIANYTLEKWNVYKVIDSTETFYREEAAGALNIDPLESNVNIYPKWIQNKFNVTLHSGENTKVLKSQNKQTLGTLGPTVPDGWIDEHYVFSGWYHDEACTQKIDFNTYELTADDDFYTTPTLAQGKVYLHTTYENDSATYNGTEDYYYTEEYSELGAGFSPRDLPTKEHYKKLGWTYTESDYTGPFPDPKDSNIIYSQSATEESGKIKPWPSDGVRPKAGKIAHLYPTYEQSEFKISFSVGEKATACNPIWTNPKDASGNAYIPSTTQIPSTSKTFSEFKGWSLTEKGTPLTTEELRLHAFTEDTILYAIFETDAWTVTFNVLVGDATYENYTKGLEQEGLKSLSSGSLSDVKKSLDSDVTLKRNNATLAGFRKTKPTSEADTYALDSIIDELTVTDDTNLYGVYYKTNYSIKVNLNGGTIDGKTGISEVTFNTSNEPVSDKNIWYSKIKEIAGGDIIAPTDLPSFYGFALKGTSNLIEFPYTVTKDIELDMIWVNNSKFMITFDAGNGDFYYVQNGVTRTTSVIAYEVDKNNTSLWTDEYQPTLENVYEQARLNRNCLANDYLINDGYTFDSWKYSGVKLDKDYLITGSKGFDASYNRETVKNWWDDSTGLLISYAEDTSSPSEESGCKTVLEETYNSAYTGTNATKDGSITKSANTFVGLEKEIKIPTLHQTYTFTTRVIGEKQDILSDGSKYAYLTIQFIDAPISGCYSPDSAKDPRYENSVIKKSSIPYLLGVIPNSLTSHFKSVNKPYLTGSSTTAVNCKTMTQSSESLFLLSAYELGGSTSSGGSAYNEATYCGSYKPFAYTYYNGFKDGSTSSAVTKRAFTYPYIDSTTYINAWTRTPVGAYQPTGKHQTAEDVYFIGCSTGNVNIGAFCCWDPMSGFGICPAFCIGTRTLS